MKAVLIVPPFACGSLRAVELARTLAAPDARPVAITFAGKAVGALAEPEGLASVTVIELPGDELPDFHGLGLLLAAAVDSLRADVVIAPACPGRPTFEPVPTALAAQLDWPVLTGVDAVERDGDGIVVELWRTGRRRRRTVAGPIVLVAASATQEPPLAQAPAPRSTLKPAQLQVPPARLRPAKEALGEATAMTPKSRTATAASANALVARLLGERS